MMWLRIKALFSLMHCHCPHQIVTNKPSIALSFDTKCLKIRQDYFNTCRPAPTWQPPVQVPPSDTRHCWQSRHVTRDTWHLTGLTRAWSQQHQCSYRDSLVLYKARFSSIALIHLSCQCIWVSHRWRTAGGLSGSRRWKQRIWCHYVLFHKIIILRLPHSWVWLWAAPVFRWSIQVGGCWS